MAASLRRVFILFPLAGLLLSLAACADPPDREMQLAEGAINAARAAGAETYARDELTAAQQTLVRAREAVEIRDYRLALSHALDSHERAQNAARMAADGKAIARSDAERALTAAAQALATAEERLRVAERARVPSATLTRVVDVLNTARTSVQEASTTFEQGDYARVLASIEPITSILKGIADELNSAIGRGGRGRG